jgi:hypothetical protein
MTYQPPGTVILRVEVGSRLHGTSTDDGIDDRDEVAIVVEHPEYVTGLRTFGSHETRTAADGQRSKAGDLDLTYHGLRKFVGLACAGNPSLIATLFAPDMFIYEQTEWGKRLMEARDVIVGQQVVPRYRGYMRSQALRLVGRIGGGRGARTGARPELVEKYGYDTKFASHMVRLGEQGLELCRTGTLHLPMQGLARQVCKFIRQGEWLVDDALQHAFNLDAVLAEYQDGRRTTELRVSPDYVAVNRLLHEIYRGVWSSR